MFNSGKILIKLKSVQLLILFVLLSVGCSFDQKGHDETLNYEVTSNGNMITIKLSDRLSSNLYKMLESETPDNAFAKQPHTMGDIISGEIICDNEFVDGDANATEQKCRIIIDANDRGVGG